MDRRSYERRRAHQIVKVESARSAPLAATMRDLSLGGMYVETGPGGLSQNSTVKVTFSLPGDGANDPIALEAVVVRRGPDGCGLMFVRMDHDAITALSGALRRYGGSAARATSGK